MVSFGIVKANELAKHEVELPAQKKLGFLISTTAAEILFSYMKYLKVFYIMYTFLIPQKLAKTIQNNTVITTKTSDTLIHQIQTKPTQKPEIKIIVTQFT